MVNQDEVYIRAETHKILARDYEKPFQLGPAGEANLAFLLAPVGTEGKQIDANDKSYGELKVFHVYSDP